MNDIVTETSEDNTVDILNPDVEPATPTLDQLVNSLKGAERAVVRAAAKVEAALTAKDTAVADLDAAKTALKLALN